MDGMQKEIKHYIGEFCYLQTVTRATNSAKVMSQSHNAPCTRASANQHPLFKRAMWRHMTNRNNYSHALQLSKCATFTIMASVSLPCLTQTMSQI